MIVFIGSDTTDWIPLSCPWSADISRASITVFLTISGTWESSYYSHSFKACSLIAITSDSRAMQSSPLLTDRRLPPRRYPSQLMLPQPLYFVGSYSSFVASVRNRFPIRFLWAAMEECLLSPGTETCTVGIRSSLAARRILSSSHNLVTNSGFLVHVVCTFSALVVVLIMAIPPSQY